MKNKAILAMGDSTRLVDSLARGLKNRTLFFSYGQEIPDLTEYSTSYWMGGAYAMKIRNVGLAQNLCSPGVNWLPELDTEFSGRTVHTGTIEDLAGETRKVWAKPSEAKIMGFPAALYSYEKIRDFFDTKGFPEDISMQWTTDVLKLNYEHRFFVAENQVITGSPYLVDGIGFRVGIDDSKMAAATAFANYVLASDSENMPPAFTLDVALNETTGKWVVIEANRAWSSGFYGSNPELALDVIELACAYDGQRWQWQPDSHLVHLSRDWDALKITNPDENSTGFAKFELN